MSIRGAPAIAVCGLLAVAVEVHAHQAANVASENQISHGTHSVQLDNEVKFQSINDVQNFIKDQLNYLVTARPTAVNMQQATETISNYLDTIINDNQTQEEFVEKCLTFMEHLWKKDIQDNHLMGQHGANAIQSLYNDQDELSILTHCNTGSLATSGFGTALGVIRQLKQSNRLKMAYFTETRPYNQGSRLTAYELIHDKISHTLICDNMAGLLMRTRPIHAVVVGADRVTSNGDTANKIGTYQLAILAQYHKIPFFITAPTTSIDFGKQTGDEIVIEERPPHEMITIRGISIAAQGVQCWNPAFDVTPAELITGIITEHGVFKPSELREKLLLTKQHRSS